jgi:hypothetical protein
MPIRDVASSTGATGVLYDRVCPIGQSNRGIADVHLRAHRRVPHAIQALLPQLEQLVPGPDHTQHA